MDLATAINEARVSQQTSIPSGLYHGPIPKVMTSYFLLCYICVDQTVQSRAYTGVVYISLAARGGNLAKIPPNQVIADFGRGSSVESESE